MNNSSDGATYYSEPHIQFLTQILTDIKRGSLLVPRFQRPFVWGETKQLDLLRSIRQGIPIGAIMVWRTESSNISCYQSLGPFPLDVRAGSGTKDYLLDGVQRLSTLYGSLNLPSGERLEQSEEDEIPYRAFFDLIEKDFLFLQPEDIAEPYQLPLFILLDSVALLRYQRRLPEHADRDQLIEESDRLAGAFRQYKVPIIPIATDDLGLATLTFQRINSQGQKMSDYHMLHALTWSTTFDLMQQLESLKNDILSQVGWEDIDEDPILKSVKLAFGLDIYKADVESFSKKLTSNPSALKSTVESIAQTANFLRDELLIPTPEFVPYSLQIVLLADAFRQFGELDSDQTDLVKNWFWFVTYSEAFSGISDDRVRTAGADLKKMLIHRRPVWSNRNKYAPLEIRPRFDFRSVRTKSFLLHLARLIDSISPEKLGTKLLSEFGRRAIHQIIPTTGFSQDSRRMASSLGNKVLIDPSDLIDLRRSLSSTTPLVCEPKNLPAYASDISLYTEVKFNSVQFVEQRANSIFLSEAAFAEITAGKFWQAVVNSKNNP